MTNMKNKANVFTYINAFDAVPMAVVCIYALTISKNLQWLAIFMLALSFIATILGLFCPESPKWHIINGRSA